MSLQIRRSEERGHVHMGWLRAKHSFSFGSYFDPRHIQFGDLRVINEDRIAPGMGFGTHPHNDMEIITYILSGALEHKDSMGHKSQIVPGEVQVMSAGTGITHSEYNASNSEEVHLLQIWIFPDREGRTPRYDQKAFSEEERRNQWKLLVSGTGEGDSLEIGQDAKIFGTLLDKDTNLSHSVSDGKKVWVQVAQGSIQLNGTELKQGDAAALVNEREVNITAREDAELLLFELQA